MQLVILALKWLFLWPILIPWHLAIYLIQLSRKPAPSQSPPPPPSAFPVAIVGESAYQDNLQRICGRFGADGVNLVRPALVILEDTNPYDDQAVRVDIDDLTVGYLNRTNALRYRKKRNGDTGHQPTVANIRGGFKLDDGTTASLGVWLKLSEVKP
jgi:hypothetical protein